MGMDPVTWDGALDVCPIYGDGFYFASFTDWNELDALKPWMRLMTQNATSRKIYFGTLTS